MNRKFHLMGLVVCLALTLSACVPVPPAVPASEQPDVSARIANAMSAAPMAVARDATIIDWPAEEGGPMVVLRQGTNNWTCITDWPASPGNDPVMQRPRVDGVERCLRSRQAAGDHRAGRGLHAGGWQ